MFHAMVCVTCVRIICVAVTFVLLFLLNFILKKTKQNKKHTPVICTSSRPFSLLYGNHDYCKRNKHAIALMLWL